MRGPLWGRAVLCRRVRVTQQLRYLFKQTPGRGGFCQMHVKPGFQRLARVGFAAVAGQCNELQIGFLPIQLIRFASV